MHGWTNEERCIKRWNVQHKNVLSEPSDCYIRPDVDSQCSQSKTIFTLLSSKKPGFNNNDEDDCDDEQQQHIGSKHILAFASIWQITNLTLWNRVFWTNSFIFLPNTNSVPNLKFITLPSIVELGFRSFNMRFYSNNFQKFLRPLTDHTALSYKIQLDAVTKFNFKLQRKNKMKFSRSFQKFKTVYSCHSICFWRNHHDMIQVFQFESSKIVSDMFNSVLWYTHR